MNRKYNTNFSFNPMTPQKAYILGLMWADGWINTKETMCGLASNDEEIKLINNIIYPNQNRPLIVRNGGCKILNVINKRIVNELKDYGFVATKSINGVPIIPKTYELFWLLGLLDGDGSIYHYEGKNLRVFFSGNYITMLKVKNILFEKLDINTKVLKNSNTKDKIFINGIEVNNNNICYTIQISNIDDSLILLNSLYENAKNNNIIFFNRKYQIYKNCLELRKEMDKCILCSASINRGKTSKIYCNNCKKLIAKLKNRQNDFYKANGFKTELEFLLLPNDDVSNINMINLSEISSKSI